MCQHRLLLWQQRTAATASSRGAAAALLRHLAAARCAGGSAACTAGARQPPALEAAGGGGEAGFPQHVPLLVIATRLLLLLLVVVLLLLLIPLLLILLQAARSRYGQALRRSLHAPAGTRCLQLHAPLPCRCPPPTSDASSPSPSPSAPAACADAEGVGSSGVASELRCCRISWASSSPSCSTQVGGVGREAEGERQAAVRLSACLQAAMGYEQMLMSPGTRRLTSAATVVATSPALGCDGSSCRAGVPAVPQASPPDCSSTCASST